MLAHELVAHGAPTLARLKVGSLLNISIQDAQSLHREVEALNHMLRPKGVELTILRQCCAKALLYLYRPSQLQRQLQQREIQQFLQSFGYDDFTLSSVLEKLCGHLASRRDFPHEIGVFLGYPLDDVQAFIANKGRNCLCSGCWKVYHNEPEARRQFAQFRKCRQVYLDCFHQGFPLSKLTVAAG